ncbi:MAG TPA: alpha-L-fucosidase [Sumerlaeia bacterium]|nr:alpha-L-fucosidase [Sumerlaeia bacterium]
MQRTLFRTIWLLAAAWTSLAPARGDAAEAEKGPYEPTWESLDSRPTPQWFADAKFGVFIHWGVYSVPAWGPKGSYSEWYLNYMRNKQSETWKFHERVYGADFQYEDFAPLFKAEMYDPDEWADVFAKSGAKYVILTSKHHDGYCLWPSKDRPGWNSMEVGPKRDLLGDLMEAGRKRGLKMGFYYSLYEWTHPLYPKEVDRYVEEYMMPQFKDAVTRYQPSIIFADGEWDHPSEKWRSRELLAWLFNEADCRRDVVVNDRWGAGDRHKHGGYYTTEYGGGLEGIDHPWEETRGMGHSFGYNRNEDISEYRSAEDMIYLLIDLVSRGGNLLLDIGPAGDGRIPVIMQERLLQIGEWLDVNGEAIYGARPWRKTGEFRITKLERIDRTVDFEWGRGGPGEPIPNDDFSSAWTGFIAPKFSEEYTFHTISDDGARLWIDGKKLIENWDPHAAKEDTATIALEAGKRHPIKVEHYEKGGDATMRLFWSSKSQPREIVPASALLAAAGPSANGDAGLAAEYATKKKILCYTSKGDTVYAISLNWPGKELVLETSEPPEKTRVTMLGREGILKWRYEEGNLRIEVPPLTIDELPCRHAWTFKIAGGLQP